MDPKDMLNDPEKIKDMIAMLQALLPQTDSVPKSKKVGKKTKETKTANSNTKAKKTAQKTKTTDSTNKFLQMQEMYMHKDDSAIDKKLSKNAPIPRTRHFSTVTVKCRVCGRSEEVNPGLVYDVSRYKCNNCSSTQG
jgi:hypothetical protein